MQFLADVFVPCDQCDGKRFKPQVLEVRYRGRSIHQVLDLTVREALTFFSSSPKVLRRLQVLDEIGLGYLRLGQPATTLSGGEAQRIKIAAHLSSHGGERLLYILDEPTTGLHFDDIAKLLTAFRKLLEAGHTLLVIEHNLDVIKTADYIIDLGPEGGEDGGVVVTTGHARAGRAGRGVVHRAVPAAGARGGPIARVRGGTIGRAGRVAVGRVGWQVGFAVASRSRASFLARAYLPYLPFSCRRQLILRAGDARSDEPRSGDAAARGAAAEGGRPIPRRRVPLAALVDRSAGRGAARGDRRGAEHLPRRADRPAQPRRLRRRGAQFGCSPKRRFRRVRSRSARGRCRRRC